MTTKRITTNRTAFFLVALVIVILAFILLGGGPWIKGMMQGGSAMHTTSLNWTQILISLGLGFTIGLLVGRRKW